MELEPPSTSGRTDQVPAAAAAPPPPSAGIDDAARFVVELEFVQALANPFYCNWLAQNRYLDDPSFRNYLAYLEYWRRPEYARYVRHPHCLAMLGLLQAPQFARAIAVAQVADEVHAQQFYHWQHHRANRVREGTAAVDGGAQTAAAAAATAGTG